MKRIYHPWHRWECFKAGFYDTVPPKGYSSNEAKELYALFLEDPILFNSALKNVVSTWKYSCEHFLSNPSLNRIAWLGQAAACIYLGLPSRYRGGYKLLSIKKQKEADLLALKYLEKWKRKY